MGSYTLKKKKTRLEAGGRRQAFPFFILSFIHILLRGAFMGWLFLHCLQFFSLLFLLLLLLYLKAPFRLSCVLLVLDTLGALHIALERLFGAGNTTKKIE